MTSNRDRQQRAAARARLEREMAERASLARRRRRTRTTVAAGVGVLLVVAGVVWVVAANTGGDDKKPGEAAASGSPVAQKCTWAPLANPSASAGASAPPADPNVKDVGTPPATGEPRTGTQTMTITTNVGVIKVQVDDAKAPCTAASFTHLASKKFFDNTKCHRMTTSQLYVLQCGDPSGTGRGGPAYQFAEENLPVDRRPAYPQGTFALANAGAGTNGSQFFIVYQDSADLPANYTVLGRVTEGLDLVKKVAEAGVTPTDPQNPSDGAPKTEVRINSLTVSAPSA